jgi:hypothetical protein
MGEVVTGAEAQLAGKKLIEEASEIHWAVEPRVKNADMYFIDKKYESSDEAREALKTYGLEGFEYNIVRVTRLIFEV